ASLYLSQVAWMTVQIMGGGFVLSVVTGLSVPICMLITGGLIAATALPGGLLTVVYTDVIQAFVLFFGFAVLAAIALHQSGGLEELHRQVPDEYVSFLGVDAVGVTTPISIFLALAISIVADPCRRLIIYSGKTESGGVWASWIAGMIEVLFASLVVIVGMYAYSLNPHLEKQDQALPWLVAEVMPIWLASLVVIAVTAAIFSSGNSNAATSGTFFIRHIYPLFMGRAPRNPLRVARWSMAGVFLVSTAMALFARSIVDFVVDALSILTSGLGVIIILGRFWNGATRQGALAALTVSAGVSLLLIFVPDLNVLFEKAVIPATVCGLIAHVLVSLFTQGEKTPFEEVAQTLAQQRRGIERA
ncbi:MAG TPA: sodium:solute symporter family protein, partial [Planctomycetaceae bacterium]|nr:sodium:solute symporter family protein [Planctomycetaceae bacterium]